MFASRVTSFCGFDKTIFFFEITSDYILHDFIRIGAALCCALSEPALKIRSEVNSHGLKIR